VSSLPRLRSVYVEPLLLNVVNVRALNALAEVELDCGWSPNWHTQERMSALLRGLAPARGRLRKVTLWRVPAALQTGCAGQLWLLCWGRWQ
jgi:hypothetical protein